MKGLGLIGLVQELRRLNPGIETYCDGNEIDGRLFIKGTVPCRTLVLPEGYYYSEADDDNGKHIITDFTVDKACNGEHIDRVMYIFESNL